MSDRSYTTITVRSPRDADRQAIIDAIAEAYRVDLDELVETPCDRADLAVTMGYVDYAERTAYADRLREILVGRFPYLSGAVSIVVEASPAGGARHILIESDGIIENYADNEGHPLVRLDAVSDAYAKDELGDLLEAHGF